MMTRSEVLAQYEVDQSGRITTSGPFEGQMLYMPAFLKFVHTHGSPGNVFTVTISDSDRTQFPELPTEAVAVYMETTDFRVGGTTLTKAQYDAFEAMTLVDPHLLALAIINGRSKP